MPVDKHEKNVIISCQHPVSQEDSFMPSYDFRCEKCGGKFNLMLSLSEYDKMKFRCPKCKSTKVKQEIMPFQVKTSKKS